MKAFYLALLTLMIILGVVAHLNLFDNSLLEHLSYQRTGIEHHEYWRLFSGHFMHLNTAHLLMNIGAFSILILTFWSDTSSISDLIALFFLMLCISTGIYFLHPELEHYVGFSGILHGLFLYYVLKILPKNKVFSILTASLIIAKIMWEQSPWVDTSDTAQLIGGNVATMAHLYGGIGGVLFGIMLLLWQKHIQKK